MLEWSLVNCATFLSPFMHPFYRWLHVPQVAEYYLVSSTVPQDGEARRSVAARITQLGPASQLLIHVLS